MKSYISAVIFIVTFILRINSNVIITLPEFEIEFTGSDNFTSFKNTETFGLPGEPNLPVTFLKILIPPEADLKNVTITLDNINETRSTLGFKVSPVPSPVTSNGIAYKIRDRNIEDGIDVDIYNSNTLFPKSYIRSVKVGKLRSYKIVDVVVQRSKYNPVTGEFLNLRSADIKVEYNKTRVVDKFSITNNSEDIVKSMVCNFDEQSHNYSGLKRRAIGDYVILTTSSFKNSSQYLEQFAGIKRNDGYKVQILTESDWGGGTGASAVSNIRAWLIENEPEYVFIIGDPNKTSSIPMVDGPTSSDKTPLTDYCYADLNGMYYNENGINKYYEYVKDGVSKTRFDQYPEIHVGRLPVYNGSYSDAEKLLKRMIDYMTEPLSVAESYRFNAVMPLNTFNDAQNGICFGEEVRTRILDPNSFSYKRIYYNHAGTTAEFPCSYEKTVDVWNSDKFGLMCLQGHGLVNMAEKAIDNTHVAELTSEGFVHGFNISCNNGRPEDPTNLGFAIMKKVGISQIASAVQIWYSTSQISNYGTEATGNDYAFSYMDNLINFKKGAGACFTKTRASQNVTSENDWQNHCELNLYGCPAIGLYTYGVNDKVDVNQLVVHQNTNRIDVKLLPEFLVKFTGLNNFIDGGTIEVYNSKGILIKCIVDVKGDELIWNYKKDGVSKGVYFINIKEKMNKLSATKIVLK